MLLAQDLQEESVMLIWISIFREEQAVQVLGHQLVHRQKLNLTELKKSKSLDLEEKLLIV